MCKRGGTKMYPHVHLHETLRQQAQTCVQISEVINVYIYTYIYICFAKAQIVGTLARGYVCDWL